MSNNSLRLFGLSQPLGSEAQFSLLFFSRLVFLAPAEAAAFGGRPAFPISKPSRSNSGMYQTMPRGVFSATALGNRPLIRHTLTLDVAAPILSATSFTVSILLLPRPFFM